MVSSSRFVRRFRSGILLLGLVGVAAAGSWARAEILNDGSTTNRLVRLANLEQTTGGNVTALRVDASGEFLVAEQIDFGGFAFPALRTVWYAGNGKATGAVYRVAAEFRPAAVAPSNLGGVMGWLHTGTSKGILLKIVPASGGESLPFSFQVSHVDFTGLTSLANENLEFLFDLDGNPAVGSFDSAWSDPTGYAPGEFARCELEFAAPTAQDLEALTNATTARVIARVFQGDLAGTPTQVGRTIELLTTLPLPPADVHRFGYFGVWSSFWSGNLIGDYRNLAAEGQVEITVNQPPSVALTQPAPGTTLTAPATFFIEADATDEDGAIVEVEFFEGTNSLGRVTAAPFVWSWSGVSEGAYVLTAVATDNQGGSTVSEPIEVTVLPWSGTAPELSVEISGETLHLSWSSTGFQLQYKSGLDGSPWIDVPNTTGVNQINLPISLGAQYFRLVGAGTPTGPELTMSVSGGIISISWPANAIGYRLQAKETLGAGGWTDLVTTGNTYSEVISDGSRFYRLTQ